MTMAAAASNAANGIDVAAPSNAANGIDVAAPSYGANAGNAAAQGAAATPDNVAAPSYGANAIWQPNYYEHVIRNESALNKIREYIINNPDKEEYDWGKLDV